MSHTYIDTRHASNPIIDIFYINVFDQKKQIMFVKAHAQPSQNHHCLTLPWRHLDSELIWSACLCMFVFPKIGIWHPCESYSASRSLSLSMLTMSKYLSGLAKERTRHTRMYTHSTRKYLYTTHTSIDLPGRMHKTRTNPDQLPPPQTKWYRRHTMTWAVRLVTHYSQHPTYFLPFPSHLFAPF